MKSFSGIVCYVKDTAKTAEFYDKLGFLFSKKEATHISVRLNWFWIDFHPQDSETDPDFQDSAQTEPKKGGSIFYISVDDVDEFYKYVESKGLKPATKPSDKPWGNREFILEDPDGYKLAFFKKK